MRISRNTRKSRVKRYVRKLEVSLVVLLERVYVVFFYFLFLEKSQIISIFFSYINLKYAFCNFFFLQNFTCCYVYFSRLIMFLRVPGIFL